MHKTVQSRPSNHKSVTQVTIKKWTSRRCSWSRWKPLLRFIEHRSWSSAALSWFLLLEVFLDRGFASIAPEPFDACDIAIFSRRQRTPPCLSIIELRRSIFLFFS